MKSINYKELKKQFAAALIGFIFIFLWYFSYKISCLSFVIPILILILIYKGGIEYSSIKKQCFATCYFRKDSLLYNFFTKKTIIYIVSFISGLIITAILIISITTYHVVDFLVLFIDLIIILQLYNYFIQNKSLNINIREPIVKNTVAVFNSIIISFIFLIISLYQSPPDYLQNTLLETIHSASNQIYSSCEIIDTITRISNEIISIKWWFMIKMTITTENKYYIKQLIWFVYLLGNYLMIFAYSKYILEILSLFKKRISK